MMQSRRSVEELAFEELAPIGFYIAVRVGFAFPESQVNTLPKAWVYVYTRDRLMIHDPVTRWVYENSGAIRWSEIEIEDPKGVFELAAFHEMHFGAAASVVDADGPGLRTYGTFSRADRELTDAELKELHARLSELHRASEPPDRLTALELDTLRLVQNGLLMKEIAHEVGVTESAIKQRLKSARIKLDARTTSQAVTTASQFGLL